MSALSACTTLRKIPLRKREVCRGPHSPKTLRPIPATKGSASHPTPDDRGNNDEIVLSISLRNR